MNHAQLKAFHAVAKAGGFSAAAKKLGLTQPAVTLQVQALEQSYNTKLFTRRGRKTEITPSGMMLLNLSKRIFSLEEEAHTLLSSLDTLEVGQLKIASTSSLHSLPLVSAFHEKYPAIRLSFMTINPQKIEEEMLDFRADIAIHQTPPTDKNLFSLKIHEAPLKLAVSTKHPWSTRKSAPLRETRDLTIIFPFDKETMGGEPGHWSHNIPYKEDQALRFESREISREAVANNLGVSYFTEQETLWDRRIHRVDIEDKKLKEATYLICHSEVRHSRLITSFIDVTSSL
ncbi:MAG: LysR family transcriptional regulator [Sneathiella sp.]|nr:LysR family transcriptional regulator [Sneathiella sp.]